MSCVETDWTVNNTGYGQKTVKQRKLMAHREAWKKVNGDIPEGMVIMHTCDNPLCINPDHLKCGTQKDNVQDCIRKGRRFDNSGINHPNTNMTPEDINSIRSMRGFYSQRQIAFMYGISQQSVAKIQLHQRH